MDYFEYIRQADREQLCALLCNMGADPAHIRPVFSMGEPKKRAFMQFLSSEVQEEDSIPTAREMFEEMGYKAVQSEICRGLPSGEMTSYFFEFKNEHGSIITVSNRSVLKSGTGTRCITNDELAAINALREEANPHER